MILSVDMLQHQDILDDNVFAYLTAVARSGKCEIVPCRSTVQDCVSSQASGRWRTEEFVIALVRADVAC